MIAVYKIWFGGSYFYVTAMDLASAHRQFIEWANGEGYNNKEIYRKLEAIERLQGTLI